VKRSNLRDFDEARGGRVFNRRDQRRHHLVDRHEPEAARGIAG